MILFYDKVGNIVGTIEGRIHQEAQLKMWIGKDTERLIVNWKPIKGTQDYEPESQTDVFKALDKKPSEIFKYKVDVKTKKLILK